tara:strand:- start:55893 stop:56249 length:357 start_codon:yes stop_codon:yes gene_type:complete
MDTVFIQGLRVDTVIGVYDWERNIRQTLVLDVELAGDNRKAAASDAVEDALDYAAISTRILAFVEASSYQLIETVAEDVAALVMSEFGVSWISLRVSKPGAVKQAGTVGVSIERGTRS